MLKAEETITKEGIDLCRKLKKEFSPINTKNVIWSHSIDHNHEINLNFVISILGKQTEICVAKETELNSIWGEFGLFLRGTCTAMFTGDVCSFPAKERELYKGERIFNPNWLNSEVQMIKNFNNLRYTGNAEHKWLRYTESFLQPKEIIGFWIRDLSYQKLLEKYPYPIIKIVSN